VAGPAAAQSLVMASPGWLPLAVICSPDASAPAPGIGRPPGVVRILALAHRKDCVDDGVAGHVAGVSMRDLGRHGGIRCSRHFFGA
jgi:hypothetical protein